MRETIPFVTNNFGLGGGQFPTKNTAVFIPWASRKGERITMNMLSFYIHPSLGKLKVIFPTI